MNPDLFDFTSAPAPESAPYARGSDTSRDAAESIRHILPHLEKVVFDAVKTAGSHGLTSDEAEAKLGMPHQTVSARMNGLARKGAIELSGDKRLTRSGRRAGVYIARWAEVA